MDNRDLQPVDGDELPLASRESQPPLVVDLPDGQKLVVGDLDPGTVIEVATWRGTGRPDSRTNRFMLGVSTNEEEGIPKKRSLPQQIGKTSEEPKQIANNSSSNDFTKPQRVHFENNNVATGVIYSNVYPDPRTGQLVTREQEKVGGFNYKKILTWTLSLLSVVGLIFALIGPIGLKFAHPKSGAGNALGSASSTIAVVKSMPDYKIGDSVITDMPNNQPSPVVAIVAATSNKQILLSTDTGYLQVRKELLHGKVVAILPFFGQIANLFSR